MALNSEKSSDKPIPAKTDVVNDQIFALACNLRLEILNEQLFLNGRDITKQANGDTLSQKALNHLRKTYPEFIKQQPNYNVVVLSGAGSSFGLGDGSFKGTGLAGLWDQIKDTDEPSLERLIDTCNFPKDSKNLEELLTKAQRILELKSDDELKRCIDKIEGYIFQMCSLKFDRPLLSPHFKILNKLTKRKVNLPRIKVFTLNYDTLFEQAATEGRFTMIDGFTFTNSRIFNGQVYDYDIVLRTGSRLKNEDNFIKKVFHLYKLHGSVDWLSVNKQVIQQPQEIIISKLDREKDAKRVMVFPRDSKFELSYEQPYFELIGRLQKTLRTENTFLITVGFSFNDKHIRSIILEALKQNPSLHLLTVSFPNIIDDEELRSFSEIDNRILLISERFEDFATNYPDNVSFDTSDPLELIVNLLADKMNENKTRDEEVL